MSLPFTDIFRRAGGSSIGAAWIGERLAAALGA